MNKLWSVCIIILLLVTTVSAWIKPIDYNGIKIKFYSDKIDKADCLGNIYDIPFKYLKGLNTIKIMEEKNILDSVQWLNCKDCSVSWSGDNRVGYYMWGSKILVSENGCGFNTLVHEVTHYQQEVQGYSYIESYNHEESFYKVLDEILVDVYSYYGDYK